MESIYTYLLPLSETGLYKFNPSPLHPTVSLAIELCELCLQDAWFKSLPVKIICIAVFVVFLIPLQAIAKIVHIVRLTPSAIPNSLFIEISPQLTLQPDLLTAQ